MKKENQKKNIIFICTDQHRVDTLSVYKKDTICKTPVLDQLAKESVVFDNAYTTCPVCTPARGSMQTGVYPSKSGMESNSFQTGCRTHELCEVPFLLNKRLAEVGYHCGYTGKWHLGVGADKEKTAEGRSLLNTIKHGFLDSVAYQGKATLPTELGYIGDDFAGHGNGGWAYEQFHQYLKDNNLDLEIINETKDKRPGDHSTVGEVITPIEGTIEYFLVNRAIDIVEDLAGRDEPFYFQLNFWGPHEPFYAPTQYLDMYRNVSIPKNPSFDEDISNSPRIYDLIRRPEVSWDFFEDTLRHYYACTSHIDHQIGRLLHYLKEKGIYDDTMIIFSADHGDNQGCHGGLENKSYSMYDDTTKIPLFIKPAREDYQGYQQEAFVGTCDIYATILKQAGYEALDDFGYGDGRALNAFIDQKDLEWGDEIVTEGMGAFSVITTQRMFRKGKYKYVFNGAGTDQLFDMEADPYEMDNLVDKEEHKEVLLWMKNCFADWMERNGDIILDGFCKMNRLRHWAP